MRAEYKFRKNNTTLTLQSTLPCTSSFPSSWSANFSIAFLTPRPSSWPPWDMFYTHSVRRGVRILQLSSSIPRLGRKYAVNLTVKAWPVGVGYSWEQWGRGSEVLPSSLLAICYGPLLCSGVELGLGWLREVGGMGDSRRVRRRAVPSSGPILGSSNTLLILSMGTNGNDAWHTALSQHICIRRDCLSHDEATNCYDRPSETCNGEVGTAATD